MGSYIKINEEINRLKEQKKNNSVDTLEREILQLNIKKEEQERIVELVNAVREQLKKYYDFDKEISDLESSREERKQFVLDKKKEISVIDSKIDKLRNGINERTDLLRDDLLRIEEKLAIQSIINKYTCEINNLQMKKIKILKESNLESDILFLEKEEQQKDKNNIKNLALKTKDKKEELIEKKKEVSKDDVKILAEETYEKKYFDEDATVMYQTRNASLEEKIKSNKGRRAVFGITSLASETTSCVIDGTNNIKSDDTDVDDVTNNAIKVVNLEEKSIIKNSNKLLKRAKKIVNNYSKILSEEEIIDIKKDCNLLYKRLNQLSNIKVKKMNKYYTDYIIEIKNITDKLSNQFDIIEKDNKKNVQVRRMKRD